MEALRVEDLMVDISDFPSVPLGSSLLQALLACQCIRLGDRQVGSPLVEEFLADALVALQIARARQLFRGKAPLRLGPDLLGAGGDEDGFVATAIESSQQVAGGHVIADVTRQLHHACIDLCRQLRLVAGHDTGRGAVGRCLEYLAEPDGAYMGRVTGDLPDAQ